MTESTTSTANTTEALTTLFALGREVTSVLDLTELLPKIPQLIARLTKFTAFAVYLLDSKKNELTIAYSVGYGIVAFAKAGPSERDTRGMAASIGIDERVVGALIITPAVLDAYRYFNPGSRWAAWTSRGAKIGSVLLVLR